MTDPIHSFEGDPLKLTINLNSLSPANAKATTCKVTFKRSDTGDVLKTCDGVKIESKKVKPDWTPDVQGDAYPVSYPVKYGVFINEKRVGAWHDHVTIWAKTVTIEAIDHKTSAAVKKAEFSIDGEKASFKTGSAGAETGKYTYNVKKKPVVVRWLPPFIFKSWETGKRDEGRIRKAKISSAGEYKAKIYVPGATDAGVKFQESGYRKQYVNLDYEFPSPPYLGQKLMIEVGAKDDESKTLKGHKIWVSCTYSKSGKRTALPKPQLVNSGSYPVEDWSESGDGKTFTGVVKVAKDQGRAKFVIDLGYEGGETWEIKVGRSDPPADDTLKIQVWRRMYFQLTVPTSGAAPSLDLLKSCMKEVFIDVAGIAEVAIDESTHGDLKVWLDGDDCGQTSGTKYWLGGNTSANRSAYEAILDLKGAIDAGSALHTKEKCRDEITAHFMICADQCDFESGSSLSLDDLLTQTDVTVNKVEGTVTLGAGSAAGITSFSFKPDDADAHMFCKSSKGTSPIKKLEWEAGGAEGTFKSSKISITYASGAPTVTVDTSANEAFHNAVVASGLNDFDLYMSYELADLYNGEAFGDRGRHLLVAAEYGGRSDAEICGTMAHELGHALGMCLAREYEGCDVEAARKDHAFQYVYSGAHCAYGLGAADYDKAIKKANFKWKTYPDDESKDLSDACKCVMFGVGSSQRSNSYCAKCQPYFKALSATQFMHTPDSLKIPRSSQR